MIRSDQSSGTASVGTIQSYARTRSDGLIPIVVGVTGHRNPEEGQQAALEAQVVQFLGRIARIAPNSPIVMLSPLARGCDRIAARAALSFRQAHPDRSIEILVPLPLPLDDYRRDFVGDPADAQEFEELLARVDGCFVLPGPDGDPGFGHGSVPLGPERDIRYRRLGLYVALQSQLVIAMWDGSRTGKVGGTSEVVDFCLGRRPSGADCGIPFRIGVPILAPHDETPVACVPTLREGGEPPTDESRSMGIDACIHEAEGSLRSIDDLNVQLRRVTPVDRGCAMLADPEDPRVRGPWRCLTIRFRRLDALAARKKKVQMCGAVVIPALAALGVVAFQWFGSVGGMEVFRPFAWISLAAYVTLILVAAAVWAAMTKRHRVEWMFVHARALAEAMRVQIAWTGSGIGGIAPDLYLARRSSDVRQLRVLLRAAILESGIVCALGGVAGDASRGVAWVAEQESYFDAASPGMQRRKIQDVRWSRIVKGLRALVAVLSLALLAISLPWAPGLGSLAGSESWLCFIVGCALAATVAVSYWQGVTLDREDLEVAERMRHVFRSASRLLQNGAVDPTGVLRAAGKEALDEHAEWFARHRERLRLPDVG